MENTQYRMLKVGEIIQAGEFFNLGVWLKVRSAVGDKVPLMGKIRRPITQQP